ncbi:hypothetical protein [Paraburkholderia agricolaris]|nr:hypothetical protein [Paraburkholderia agricolaris]
MTRLTGVEAQKDHPIVVSPTITTCQNLGLSGTGIFCTMNPRRTA